MKKCIDCGLEKRSNVGTRCRPCQARVSAKNPERNQKVSISKLGAKNPMWKGNAPIRMTALHNWVRRNKPMPKLCEDCKKVPPLDLANKGTYDRNFDNWEYLCRRCHMTKDGRILRMKTLNREYIEREFGKTY